MCEENKNEEEIAKKKPVVLRSKVTGKMYDDNECVHIWNIQQIMAYLKSGSQVVDIFPGHDQKTGEEKLCFVFSRKDFDLLQPLWIAHKL